MKIEHAELVIGFEHTTEAPLAEQIHELGPSTSGDESSELSPSLLTVDQGMLEGLLTMY